MKLVKPADRNRLLLYEDMVRIMRNKNITATDIHKATGLTRQTISRALNDRTKLTLENLCKVANCLGYKVALVEMSDEEKRAYI